LWIWDDVYISSIKDLFNEGGTILDVGCGAGSISVPLSAWFRVHSLDLSRSMLDRVQVRAEESGSKISVVHADNGQIPFKDHVFDGTLCKFALWPVPDPEETVREMVRVTKKDGTNTLLRRRISGQE
jgi:ubiquinone/menaquinone biosynthesis C-methylase UbiE